MTELVCSKEHIIHFDFSHSSPVHRAEAAEGLHKGENS